MQFGIKSTVDINNKDQLYTATVQELHFFCFALILQHSLTFRQLSDYPGEKLFKMINELSPN